MNRCVDRWRRRAAISLLPSLLFLLSASMCGDARSDTWAERLGYPADKKVVLLQLRGMGLCYETNAVSEGLEDGGLKFCCSAMAVCPWFSDFAVWSGEHPGVDVGLTLALNSELPRYRWQPLAADESVRSLVDQEGFLWSTTVQTTVNADVVEVERELHAQILRAHLSGVRPSHFTSHLGTLYARPDLTELYLRLARQYWIPAVVVELTEDHLQRFRAMGYPLPDELLHSLSTYPLPKVDDLQFLPAGDSYDQVRRKTLSLLDQLPIGLTNLAIYPAADSEALPRIIGDAQQRQWEARLLRDEAVLARLAAEDVVLTTWREVMQRFEGTAPPSDEAAAATADVSTAGSTE